MFKLGIVIEPILKVRTIILVIFIILDVWDTAGQDCFAKLHNSYYFGAHVAIFVFDITRKLTYQHLKNWY